MHNFQLLIKPTNVIQSGSYVFYIKRDQTIILAEINILNKIN